MSGHIGIAIIGGGIFAKEEHLPAVLAAPELSLKAVYSRSLASAAKLSENLAQKVEWYSDETADQGRGYDDLLKVEEIQAVIIALPITNQPEYIRKALIAGKHVLSEKPIAKDVAAAEELLEWYHSNIDGGKTTWTVAENFRFLDSFLYASEEVAKLGRLLGFRIKMTAMVEKGGKYYETPWRKTPEYQGGFLLDGGVHFIAGTRLMLGPDNEITRTSAFTTQLQEHLPPIDTLNATAKTKSGVSGTIGFSFGTTFKGAGYEVACEKGTVTVVSSKVTIEKNGTEETKSFPEEGNGVKQEVRAWAQNIAAGTTDPRQSPEEALKDLKTLEAMFRSGEKDGEPVETGL